MKIKDFFMNDTGVAAILFALSVPVIIGSAGVGVDLAKAYHTKNKLEKTLDAAVLAGASSNLTGTALEDFIEDYVDSNFKTSSFSKIDITSLNVVEDTVDKTIEVSATAESTNTFMSFFGKNYVTVAAEAMSKEKLTGVEVVLVLDDSESMKFDNKSDDLKTASKGFIDTLYDTATITGGEFKLGIVPYGSFVNVGPYGLGKTPSGGVYGSGTAFVNNPLGLEYTSNRSQNETNPNWKWSGCVLEHDHYNTGGHSPNWDMYFFCHDENATRINTGGWHCRFGHTPSIKTCIQNKVYGPPYPCPQVKTVDGVVINYTGTCKDVLIPESGCTWTPQAYIPHTVNIHEYCPKTIVQPMIDNTQAGGRAAMKSAVNHLSGASGAKTNSNLGMIWGYELISPEFPFEEGASWGSSKWTKVIVFMTDGNIQADSHFGPYYPLDVGNQGTRTNTSKTRFTEACNKAKSKGILVYTVQFEGSAPLNPADQAILEDCATDSTKALKASNGAALIDTFKDIAEDLGNIYLAK